jgi:iron(III) transport system substrate-binding protein
MRQNEENSFGLASKSYLSRRAFVAGAASAGLICRAWAADDSIDPALVEAARREGTGMLYTNFDPTAVNEMMALLRQRYNVNVDVTRLTSGALAQRFASEAQSGNNIADAFLTTDKLFIEIGRKKGWFGDLAGVKGLDRFPVSARSEYALVIGYVPYSLAWNATIVNEELDNWQTLSDPKWNDRLLLADLRGASTATTAWYLLLNKLYGDDFMRDIGKQATFVVGAIPGLQQVAAGAKALFAPAVHQVFVSLKEKNAPISESFPQPTVSTDNVAAIPAKAPHPNMARLIVSFTATIGCQAILNKNGFSPLPNVPTTRPMPRVEAFDFDALEKDKARLTGLLGLS